MVQVQHLIATLIITLVVKLLALDYELHNFMNDTFNFKMRMFLTQSFKRLVTRSIYFARFITKHQLHEHRQMRQMTDSDGCPFYAKEWLVINLNLACLLDGEDFLKSNIISYFLSFSFSLVIYERIGFCKF